MAAGPVVFGTSAVQLCAKECDLILWSWSSERFRVGASTFWNTPVLYSRSKAHDWSHRILGTPRTDATVSGMLAVVLALTQHKCLLVPPVRKLVELKMCRVFNIFALIEKDRNNTKSQSLNWKTKIRSKIFFENGRHAISFAWLDCKNVMKSCSSTG